jgi:hypothetical protein
MQNATAVSKNKPSLEDKSYGGNDKMGDIREQDSHQIRISKLGQKQEQAEPHSAVKQSNQAKSSG